MLETEREPEFRVLVALAIGGFVLGVVLPLIAALCDLFLLYNLDSNAKWLGCIWLALGVAYLAYLTRFFSQAAPELDFVEEAA